MLPTSLFSLLALVYGQALLPAELEEASSRDFNWRFTRRRAPSADAEVAACIAGQARTLVYPAVHQRFRSNILNKLGADGFAVLSASFSEHANLTTDRVRTLLPAALTQLDPVSSVVTDEDSLATMAPAAFQHCFRSKDSFGVYRSFYRGCSPYLTLAISWRGCLTMIGAAEAERPAPYRLVARLRPDLLAMHPFAPLPLGARWSGPLATASWAAYRFDFAALMTRDVAEVGLRQFERTGTTPSCGGYESAASCAGVKADENCNPCLVGASGFQVWTWDLPVEIVRECGTISSHTLGGKVGLYPACSANGMDADLDYTTVAVDKVQLNVIWSTMGGPEASISQFLPYAPYAKVKGMSRCACTIHK